MYGDRPCKLITCSHGRHSDVDVCHVMVLRAAARCKGLQNSNRNAVTGSLVQAVVSTSRWQAMRL